jgi:hypothetical protein
MRFSAIREGAEGADERTRNHRPRARPPLGQYLCLPWRQTRQSGGWRSPKLALPAVLPTNEHFLGAVEGVTVVMMDPWQLR